MNEFAPVYTLSREDKWNLNRLYMHTSEAENDCMTTVDLSQSSLRNARGMVYPSSGLDLLGPGSTPCPSTAYDGHAHYFKMDTSGVSSDRRFHAWIKNAWPNVKQYVHTGDFNPYKRGSEQVNKRTLEKSELHQVASTVRSENSYYQFRVVPDCTALATSSVSREGSLTIAGSLDSFSATECSSSIASRGAADFYSIYVQSETIVTVALESNYFDTFLYLRNGEDEQSASPRAEDDDSGVLKNSILSTRLARGYYTIEATSYGSQEWGDYTLKIDSFPYMLSETIPTILNQGETWTASLASVLPTDLTFRINASDSNRLSFGSSCVRDRVVVQPQQHLLGDGDPLTLTGCATGIATLSVYNGSALLKTYTVTVRQGIQSPGTNGSIPEQAVNVGDSSRLTVSGYFTGTVDSYSAASSNTTVATTSVSLSNVTVTGRATGTATITVTATNTHGSTDQVFQVTVSEAGGLTPPTNVRLSEVPGEPRELRIEYEQSGLSPHRYEFEIGQRNIPQSNWYILDSETDSSPPETLENVARGYYYRVRGKKCTDSTYTTCGSWSNYSNVVELSDPEIAITGLGSTLDVNSNDSFSVDMSDLTLDETYTVAVKSSSSGIGFNSNCTRTATQTFSPLIRAGAEVQVRTFQSGFRLYACSAPGGTVTAELRKGSNTGVLEDRDTHFVTVRADDPVFNSPSYSASIPENTALNTSIVTVSATDPNGDALAYSIYSGNTGNVFAIGSVSGEITLAGTLDRTVQSSYSLMVRATDPSGNYDTATVSIAVTEPVLPTVETPASIRAGSKSISTLHVEWSSVANSDLYELQYRELAETSWTSASSSLTSANFTIQDLTCGTWYNVRVRAHGDGVATDDSWGSYTSTLTAATDICPYPVFDRSSYSGSIHENAEAGSSILTVSATDPNGDALTYGITNGNTGDVFGLGSSSGEITLAGLLDRSQQSTYRLTVEAADADGYTDTVPVTISITPPQLPAVLTPSNVRRSSATETSITVAWDEVDNSSKYRVEYRQGASGSWRTSTSAATGLTHTVSRLSCATSYQVQVTAHGDGVVFHAGWGTPSPATTLSTAVCPEPVFQNEPYNFEVPEGSVIGTRVGTVYAIDPNGETVRYSMSGSNAGDFAIDANTGAITGAATLDHDSRSAYALTVVARDPGNHTDSTIVTITVLENAPPVIGSLTYDFVVRDDIAVGTSVGFLSATDPEGDPLTYSFAAGHGDGDFAINASTGEITVADTLNAIDIDLYLILAAASDGASYAYTSVAIMVTDSAGCDSGTAITEPASKPGLVSDCQTLLSIRDALAGTGGSLNWSGRRSMSSWDGITLGGTPQRVTGITVASAGLDGYLPAGLGSLPELEDLDLSWNYLSGSIPVELGSLTGLTRLSLDRNSLSGDIPTELGSLSSLEVLRLSQNRLSGSIPTELGSLSSLEALTLFDNRLTGSVPASFTSLTGLRSLFLSGNGLGGCLPAALRSIQFNDFNLLTLPDC